MHLRKTLGVSLGALILGLTLSATAQNWQRTSSTDWITRWLALDLVKNTGGFNESAKHDYISEGTNGKYTYESVSTPDGVWATKDMVVSLPPAQGGDLRWKVIEIDPNDDRNMSHQEDPAADFSNITTHWIIVISSPNDRTTTMHPAHDDYAQIWINGEKVYDNPEWTGGATKVTKPTQVDLVRGANVLLFKCGESGGADYANLHFEDSDKDLKILPTTDGLFFEHLAAAPVEPAGKLSTTWGDLKR